MTNKQALKSYRRIRQALERVETQFNAEILRDSDSSSDEHDFQDAMLPDIQDMIRDLYRWEDDLREEIER